MTEPVFFGLPVSLAFLYFVVYSCLGWCMETIYCSVIERRWVSRGFLYGPICPIYGVGVLMMICWFKPFMDDPLVFYLVATVCMSTWEYFVGWFLETTTHIKYWDYSHKKFNLKGRICLQISLCWGVLSYIVLYFIHPRVAESLQRLQGSLLYFADGVLLGIILADAAATVTQLVKASQMMKKLRQAGDELRLKAHLGRAELSDLLVEARSNLGDRLEDLLPDQLDDAGRTAKERYDELMARTEFVTRRFRETYHDMRASLPDNGTFESVKRRGERVKEFLKNNRKK